MRFALYGEEPAGLAVARAVAASPGHVLTRIVGRPHSHTGLPGGSRVRFCQAWENLLTDSDVDAVIVAGNSEEMQQAVRQLALSGRRVLVSPELLQPTAFFYEMALLEAESPGRLFPLLGLRGHPLVLKLGELIASEALGRVRHGQLDRRISGAAPAAQPLLTDDDLTLALLADADLLRALCGSYDQVTASRSGDAGQGYSLATVTLAGSAAPQAVWTASATSGPDEWRLTLVGDLGTAVLEGDPGSARFRLTLALAGQPPTRFRLTLALAGQPPTIEECVDDAGPWLLETFLASSGNVAISPSRLMGEGRGGRETGDAALSPLSPRGRGVGGEGALWNELARTVELVDAVERSVRRRRTIDVYFETPSERGVFKTQMTAVGCSLLVLTLVAVVIYLSAAAALAIPPLVKKIVAVLIFVPLGIFLAMQLLFFVTRPATRDGR
jgi:predicted dehydrogenase